MMNEREEKLQVISPDVPNVFALTFKNRIPALKHFSFLCLISDLQQQNKTLEPQEVNKSVDVWRAGICSSVCLVFNCHSGVP